MRTRNGYQSSHHTVILSRGHVVTVNSLPVNSSHTHVSSHSQLVTSEHITKPFCCRCKCFICTPVR